LVIIILKILNKSFKSNYYYKKATIIEYQNVLKSDEDCFNGHLTDISYIYTTLKQKRLYGISQNIGCFNLNRRNMDVKLEKLFWDNWEYFSYFSPLWKKRYDQYLFHIDHERKKIIFEDDDQQDEFYNKYGYEPDEQPKEVQELSIKEIPYSRLDNWINELFIKKIKRKIRINISY